MQTVAAYDNMLDCECSARSAALQANDSLTIRHLESNHASSVARGTCSMYNDKSGSLADIVTGTDSGAISNVNAFDNATGVETAIFLAYGAAFTGDIRVATGDLNGDGFADIMTGAGNEGLGHIKAFDGNTGAEILSFLACGPSYSRGVYVAGSDLVVPEPSIAVLLSLGVLSLAIVRAAHRRR